MCEINHDRALPGGSSKLEVDTEKKKKEKAKGATKLPYIKIY